MAATAKKFRRKKTIPYKFGEKHKAYIRRCRDSTINVAEGAVRAGKTVDHILAFCTALKTTRDKIHLASASTVGNAKIILGDCKGFGIEHYFRNQCRWGKYKGNEALIIKGPDTKYRERIIIFTGAMMENSFKSIRGNSYGMWIATEINLHAKSFVQEAFNRTIAAIDRKVFWDLNPDNPKSWIYTEYIDKYAAQSSAGAFLGGYNYAHFTIYDNINVTDEQREAFISQYNPQSVEYRRKIKGERCVAEGLVFQQFADNPDRFTVDGKYSGIKFISIGVDFGGNGSKTTFVASAIIGNFQKLGVVADYKIKGGKRTIDSDTICRELMAFYKFVKAEYPTVRIPYIFCDCAEQTLITGILFYFKRHQIPIAIQDSYKGTINNRIYALNSLMTQGRFFVHKDCNNVMDSLSSQVWDTKDPTKDVRLDDGTFDIDTADALEYSFSSFIKYFNVMG